MSEFFRRVRFGRRPVSPVRRGLGLAGLVLLLAVLVTYHAVTRPERIRAFAVTFLEEIVGGEVRIGSAHFNPFEGLRLRDVAVATPADPVFHAKPESFEDRVIFTCPELYLRLRPFSLLTGDLLVPEIVAAQPTLRLLRDPETGRRNWQLLSSRSRGPRGPSAAGPTIRLRDARVDLEWTRVSAERSPSRFSLDVTAVTAGSAVEYEVRWRTRTEPIENGRFVLDMATPQLRTAEGGLPTIPVASVRWAAPLELERWIDLLDLRGQVRTDSLSYDPTKASTAAIVLHQASLAVPSNEEDRATPRDQRYLTFTDVEGRLTFSGAAADIALRGRWRGGLCHLTGRIFGDVSSMRSLDDLGFDLELKAENILLPSLAGRRSAPEERFIRLWPKLADFCETYSAVGRIDAAFRVAKPAGRGAGAEFRGGALTARGASAAFAGFPYRLEDVWGTVRFDPDGRVYLLGLLGRHGGGQVLIRGMITTPNWEGAVFLHIEGFGVEMDEALRSCLPEEYQAVWERFDPRGIANVLVDLRRSAGGRWDPRPWDTHVTADLLGIDGCYASLPLPASNVRGQVQITNDQFYVDNVRGWYRDSTWSLDGIVRTPVAAEPDVHLALRASNVPIDAELVAAIPRTAPKEPTTRPAEAFASPFDGAEALGMLGARGRADLNGAVFTGASGALQYDLRADVRLDSARPPWPPVAFTDIVATVRAAPGGTEITRLSAKCLGGRVSGGGVIPAGDAGEGLSLAIAAEGILLDEELLRVLPPKAAEVWVELRPTGRIDADVLVSGRDASGLQAEVRPLGIGILPTAFPIAFSDVRGAFRIDAYGVRIREATARTAGGTIAVDGEVMWAADALAGKLAVRASGLAFCDELRKALPWRLRRAWNAAKPIGTFDLALREVTFRREAGRSAQAAFDGRVELHSVTLTSAGTLSDMEGWIAARGAVAGGGAGIRVDGECDFARLRFGGRLVTNLRARLAKSADEGTLRFEDLRADIYGGLATGFAELRFEAEPVCGLSLAVRDLSLAQFLEGAAREGAGPIRARGTIDGTFFLSGPLGDRQARRGGGTLEIRDAEVVRIPLFLSVVGSLAPGLRDENAFDAGSAEFVLQGDDLTLDEIDLRGGSLSLVGAGRLTTSTQQMDIRLLAGPPQRIPRLGLLSELAEGAARELMEVHVTGPLDAPRVQTTSLRSLRRTLELLAELRSKRREPPQKKP